MIRLMKNELFKVFRLKKLYVFMLITLALSIIGCIVMLVARHNPKSFDPVTVASAMSMNGQRFAYENISSMTQMLVIFIAILLADIISDEYKNGTLKLSLIRPVDRISLITSKIVSVVVSLITLTLFTMIAGYLCGTIFFGYGKDFTVNNIVFSGFDGFLLIFKSYLIALIPYIAISMIILFVSVLSSSMGATIGISIGLLYIFVLTSLIKPIRKFILTYYFDFHTYFIGDINWSRVGGALLVMAVYAVFGYTAAVISFRKKDLLM